MKKNYFFAFFFMLLCVSYIQAQLDIISPEELVSMMGTNENLVILDVSKGENYLSSHIEGANYLNHEDLYEDGEVEGIIKSWIDLAEIFGKHGVNKNSTVVLYDEGSQKNASRVYWILKYIAKGDVKILHKDGALWKIDGVPMSSEVKAPENANMSPGVMPSIYISMEEIAEKLGDPDFALVDVRTVGEFEGKGDDIQPLPGAINLDYKELLYSNGAFKAPQEIAEIAKEHGLTKNKEIAFYCKEGIRACVAFVAFRNILGYPNVKVYDGSLFEWKAKQGEIK
jgi:thiosulfate/3-mercaptopyruvate sulfurtransferase